MSRAGVRPDIAERFLGHGQGGVLGIYDRHVYRDEKAQALKMLAGLIDNVLRGDSENGAKAERLILTSRRFALGPCGLTRFPLRALSSSDGISWTKRAGVSGSRTRAGSRALGQLKPTRHLPSFFIHRSPGASIE
jgi:hypothetical protein